MPLVSTVIQSTLNGVLSAMLSGTLDDSFLAQQLALAVTAYAATGIANTVDTGTGPVGPYVGAGVSTMTIVTPDLQSGLFSVLTSSQYHGKSTDLAGAIVDEIHKACTKSDIIIGVTTGVQTPPPPATPVPYVGPIKGSFTGIGKAAFSSGLKGVVTAMDSMSSGGDSFLANQFGLLFDAYLKMGVVNVTIQPPASGSGTGMLV